MKNISPKANEFQISFVKLIVDMLEERGIGYASREEILGSEIAYIVSFHDLDVWIYVDGCNLDGNEIDRRFEIYDFDNLESLREAAFDSIVRVLNAD